MALFWRMVEGLEARVAAARNEWDSFAAALSRALLDKPLVWYLQNAHLLIRRTTRKNSHALSPIAKKDPILCEFTATEVC